MRSIPEIDLYVDIRSTSYADAKTPIDVEDALSLEPVAKRTGAVVEVKPNVRSSEHLADTKTNHRTSGILDETDIHRVGEVLNVPTNLENAHLINFARREAEQLGMTIARIGIALAALKTRLPHGEYLSAIEEVGLPQQRAAECMQIARFLAAQPDDRLRQFAKLPKSKVLELAKAEPEVLDDYLNSNEDGDELEGLSVRELRLRLRELREKNNQVKDELLNKDMELETVRNELKAAGYERYKQSLNNVSPCYLEIREESYVTADIILAGLNNLRRLYEGKLGPNCDAFSQPPNPRAYLDDDGQVAARRSAAATLYHNLAGSVGPVLRMMRELEAMYPDGISDAVLVHHYSEEELNLFSQNRKALIAADDAARKRREAERHNAVTKGQRGRPKKVTED